MIQRNPGLAVFLSMLAGFVVGIASLLYLILNWIPGDWMYRDATPNNLAYNGESGHYRDFYVTYVAQRYQAMATTAQRQREGLDMARNMLGVSTGDVTPAQAADVVSATLSVISRENDKESNKNAGWFTTADETAVARLTQELNRTRAEPATLVATPGGQGILGSRGLSRALGFLPLLLLVLAAGLLAWWLANATRSAGVIARNDPAAPDGQGDTTVPPDAAPDSGGSSYRPAPLPIDPAVQASAPPTTGAFARVAAQPGSARATYTDLSATTDDAATTPSAAIGGAATAVMPLAAGSAASAVSLSAPAVFPPIDYAHGDESFDSDCDITGPKGLLVGTCGASIAERIGMTQPSQVNALMLSVFDKAAFKTSSKVLVVPDVLQDQVVLNKLRQKGDVLPARAGDDIVIDTQSLRVSVRVNTLDVAVDDTTRRTYFRNVTLTFSAQQKQ